MAKLDGNGDGGRRLGLDFGRFRARSRSWRVGVGGRRVCAAPGATNRGGAASFGRCDEWRRIELVSALHEREEWIREGRTGSFPASARGRAVPGRDGQRVEAHRWPQSPVWPASYTATCTGKPLFLRLMIFNSNLTN